MWPVLLTRVATSMAISLATKIFLKINKGDDIMLPLLAIEVGSIVAGRVIAHGIVKWIKE